MMTTTTHLVALPVALEVIPWIFQRMSPRRRQWLRRLGNIIQSVFVVFYDIPNYTHGIRRTFRYYPPSKKEALDMYAKREGIIAWTNRESNPGPLPDASARDELMLREYYTTKPFARCDVER
jgi:hypothetical protein